MRQQWWKILSILLLLYTFTAGFLTPVPYLGNLYETIRNFYFHVPMWATMMTLFTVSVVNAVLFLWRPNHRADILSDVYARTGVLFSLLGLVHLGQILEQRPQADRRGHRHPDLPGLRDPAQLHHGPG
jgi:heme exporter protein C